MMGCIPTGPLVTELKTPRGGYSNEALTELIEHLDEILRPRDEPA